MTSQAHAEVESRAVDIWSNGIRLSGDLWYPSDLKKGEKLPAIILCNGWSGTRKFTNRLAAPDFAKAGYVVLSFDYKGWGDSNSRLVVQGKMPKPDSEGMVAVTAKAIRGVVDAADHREDIISAIDFMYGEPMVDNKRIGLWGTSMGGGHALYVTAHDRRVKCLVSQVGSIAKNTTTPDWLWPLAAQQARGEIEPIPTSGKRLGNLPGIPHWAKIVPKSAGNYVDQIKVPTLIISAEEEEFDSNKKHHGDRIFRYLTEKNIPVRHEVFDCKHFEIYSGEFTRKAIALEIEWYDKYLKGKK
ncbi:MAG: alpha/beta fold hydrolase [Deltaproteobacteria bacterium]|nr:alpha/beta fold hydrolase [Deltaproteobacteria bacterium]